MPVTPTSPALVLTAEQLKTQANAAIIESMGGVELNLAVTILSSRKRGAELIYGGGLVRSQELMTAYGEYGPTLVYSDLGQRLLQAIQVLEPESTDPTEVLMELMKPFAQPVNGVQPIGTSPAGSQIPAGMNIRVWNGETEVNLNAVIQNVVAAWAPLWAATHVTVEAAV